MIINGKEITKDIYNKLMLMKINGIELTYGTNHDSPIGYTTTKTTPSEKIDVFEMRGIPMYFWDNLSLYKEIFDSDKITVLVNKECISIQVKAIVRRIEFSVELNGNNV